MRVKVWKSKKEYLGEGEFLGCVPMTEVSSEDEYKANLKDFQKRILNALGALPKDLIDTFERKFEEMWGMSEPYGKMTTPKIWLDNGKIVYGCQIWWEAIT